MRRLALRYRIWSTERYMKRCEDDNLIESLQLDAWRADLQVMRCDLAQLAPPMSSEPAPVAAEAVTELGHNDPPRREPVALVAACLCFMLLLAWAHA